MGVESDRRSQSPSSAKSCFLGKVFRLRGGEEQRSLKPSKFVHSSDPDCHTCVENGSKNLSGINNKEVPVLCVCRSSSRCLVYLLDAYLAKFPANALEMDTFCLRPRLSYMSESPRYDRVPVG